MLVKLVRNNKIKKFILPEKVLGSYWLTDIDKNGKEKNLINIEAIQGEWVIKSDFETKIITSGGTIESTELEYSKFYFLKIGSEKEFFYIYCTEVYDNSFEFFELKEFNEIYIGSDDKNHIKYQSGYFDEVFAKIFKLNNNVVIEDSKSRYGVYVNSKKIKSSHILEYGDNIFLMGLTIIYMKDFILINNNNGTLKVKEETLMLFKREVTPDTIEENENIEILDFYQDEDYFLQSPRFITTQDKKRVIIDAPPQKQEDQDVPVIFTIGPMLTMAATSAVTLFSTLSNISSGKSDLSAALPSLIISVSMLATVIIWPSLMKGYQKKQKEKREKERQEKYSYYLQTKKKECVLIINEQKATLNENNIPLIECQNIIMQKKRKLWERKVEHEDFLSVRIGIGKVPINAEIQSPSEHFTMDDDNLRKELDSLVDSVSTVFEVPITFSFTKRNNLVITGTLDLRNRFLNNIILQIIASHSFEDVKLVFLTEDEENKYDMFKMLPHIWDDEKKVRFFASKSEDMTELSFYLESVYNSRKYKDESTKSENTNADYRSYSPFFILITDNIKKVRNLEIINKILSDKKNFGFSLIILNDGLSNLPDECSNFAFLDTSKSAIVQNELNSSNQEHFFMDMDEGIKIKDCILKLANVPIKFIKREDKLPSVISFLEMYNVGKVEQLNVINRWRLSDPTKSLSAPIGVHKDGELFKIDLHEKIHGPHGLIAGMTGSGKSELIISYILSMAINYHPEEVQFALIDYKGGGLTGAFEKREQGIKLPHLVGTITNLDTTELNRSLASIQSELRRRQVLFNEARDKLGESTIDIYKYQRLYREGKVDEPVSHLIIISDEFAELKKEQGDFMQQLITTARIGRSLGVHLILATQKPSGIVDDQIWSNSKFRISLKVQEKSDSMDVIKVPDAASLKLAGRFYLQVGYNDYFALGQAAWAGAQYFPTDKNKKKVDKSLTFIDDLGNIIKSENIERTNTLVSQGEEVTNIVNYLSNIPTNEFKINKLWLDRIPNFIYVLDLKEKYKYKKESFIINPLIGEYDNPNNQKQHLLTLNLTNNGNVLIYGSSGSGKELLLTTIIFSSIISYSVDEVNFYIIDFGAEMLRMFNNAPHVGDIILNSDDEKITNIFKKLMTEMNIRKKEFLDFNGDYLLYCKSSGKTKPLIVLIINNFDAFNESHEEYSDLIATLAREGVRYGIRIIITTSGANSIRYRISQNFSQQLVLQFNEKSDYTSILGNTGGIYPSKSKGRGIVKLNDVVYEFQTAYPYVWENINDYIRIICDRLGENNNKNVEKVKILPQIVNYEVIKNDIKDLTSLPVGIYKNTLENAIYNFKDKVLNLISSEDIEHLNAFVKSLLNELVLINNTNLIIIDTENLGFVSNNENVIYYKENYDNAFIKIEELINKESIEANLIVIIGFEIFRNSISSDNVSKLESLIQKAHQSKNTSFIITDLITSVKKYEYEPYYRGYISNNNGIWIGNGIIDQFILKITSYHKELREEIGKNFGYIVEKGQPKLIKLINISSEEVKKDEPASVEVLEF